MNNNNVAEVIPLKINLNHGFYYHIPLPLKETAEVGKRVIIPFRNSKKVGIIVNIIESTELQDLKEIEEVLDPVPILSQEIFLLADWMAKYYLCPKGVCRIYYSIM
jgi:primosomal protein N' (replication factor Y)